MHFEGKWGQMLQKDKIHGSHIWARQGQGFAKRLASDRWATASSWHSFVVGSCRSRCATIIQIFSIRMTAIWQTEPDRWRQVWTFRSRMREQALSRVSYVKKSFTRLIGFGFIRKGLSKENIQGLAPIQSFTVPGCLSLCWLYCRNTEESKSIQKNSGFKVP